MIAKGLSWETSEDLNGILKIELFYKGKKYEEEVSGCKDGISKYFIVIFSQDQPIRKVSFNCNDSINNTFLPKLDLNQTWRTKPEYLLKH